MTPRGVTKCGARFGFGERPGPPGARNVSGSVRVLFGVGVFAVAAAGCRETPRTASPPRPATAPPIAATQEVQATPAGPGAAPPGARQAAPATQPISPLPAPPKFVDAPPYSVDIEVRKPDDPQAGWLRIEALADAGRPARVSGIFPEPNQIRVRTENVSLLVLDLSMLPLQPNRRRNLHIDGQPIELSQRHRGPIQLHRSETGDWKVLTPVPR